MNFPSARAAMILGALAQCDAPNEVACPNSTVPGAVSHFAPPVLSVQDSVRHAVQFGVEVEALPHVPKNEAHWVDATSVGEALARCVQGNGVVCSQTANELTCFSVRSGDFIPVHVRIEEKHETEAPLYVTHVAPVFQDSTPMDFVIGKDDEKVLALACQEVRNIIGVGSDASSLCSSGFDSYDCDLWATSAIAENESLNERFHTALGLSRELTNKGWSFEWKQDRFTFVVSGLPDAPVTLQVAWDTMNDFPTVVIQTPGPFDSNGLWCEHPCQPEDAVRLLDSSSFLLASDVPVWMIPYAYSTIILNDSISF